MTEKERVRSMLQYWLWLSTRKGLGPRGVQKVLTYFSAPQAAFQANQEAYRLAKLTEKECAALADKDLEGPRRIIEDCAERDIRILTMQDAVYPERLRNIADPPAVLYYRGNLPPVDSEPLVAVIGSRDSSIFGLSMAKRLGYQIASCGGIVVSGMAKGGDGMAMTGALSAGRPVIGVLGCGVDIVYPACNRHIYEDTVRRGCVISEYPPGTTPTKYTFPARNRIISGLSLGVVVVEAPVRSGTLITADFALEQGRDVFAVPGNANVKSCAGSNKLLKEGAALVESGWDVMREYQQLFPERIRKIRAGQAITLSPDEMRRNLPPVERSVPVNKSMKEKPSFDKKAVDIPEQPDYIVVQDLPGLSEDERKILTVLQDGPRLLDDLIDASGVGPGAVLASLTMLEIKKYVVRLLSNRYELARKKK